MSSTRTNKGTKIYVNVYDLSNNDFLYPMGLGFYHSGLQIEETEYSFSQQGVFGSEPKNAPPAVFRESILLGHTNYNYREIESIVDSMKDKFPGNTYNVVANNCNCFSEALAKKLISEVQFPTWINRMAYYSNLFSCMNPGGNTSPVQQQTGGSFSGKGRTLSSTTTSSNNIPSDEITPDITRQKLLNATLSRLNKDN
eukprot:gene5332-9141_t